MDLEPGPAQKWWAFLKPPKKAVVEVVPEEEETVPVPRSYRVIRVLRGTFMTGLVGCVTLYAWNISHQAVRIVQKPSIHAPEFVQNIQKRSTSIVKELSDALN